MKLKVGMVIHCDTEEKANTFLKECHKQGWKWRSGKNLINFKGEIDSRYNLYKSETVYLLDDCGIRFDLLRNNPSATSFDDLFKQKQVKIYHKSGYVHGDVEKVIINEPYVIVYLDTEEKGLSKCCPDDEFNEELGYKIAYKRAIIKKLKNEIKDAEGILRFLIS